MGESDSKTNLRLVIASVPDREELVAELWCGDQYIGEVYYEEGMLQLLLHNLDAPQSYKAADFVTLLQKAMEELMSP